MVVLGASGTAEIKTGKQAGLRKDIPTGDFETVTVEQFPSGREIVTRTSSGGGITRTTRQAPGIPTIEQAPLAPPPVLTPRMVETRLGEIVRADIPSTTPLTVQETLKKPTFGQRFRTARQKTETFLVSALTKEKLTPAQVESLERRQRERARPLPFGISRGAAALVTLPVTSGGGIVARTLRRPKPLKLPKLFKRAAKPKPVPKPTPPKPIPFRTFKELEKLTKPTPTPVPPPRPPPVPPPRPIFRPGRVTRPPKVAPPPKVVVEAPRQLPPRVPKTRLGKIVRKIPEQPRRVATGLVEAIVGSEVITRGTKGLGRVTAPEQERVSVTNRQLRSAFSKGIRAEGAALKKEGVLKSIAFEGVSSLISSKGGRKAFEDAVREQFKKQGLTGQRLENAVALAKRERVFSGSGELGSLVFISKTAEKVGRAGTRQAIEAAAKKRLAFQEKQAFTKIFGITGARIGQAGFVEGFSQEISQQRAREQKVDIRKAAGLGAVGGVSAAALGGFIAGTALTKPRVSKVTEAVASIADPFEKPGDIAESVAEAARNRIFGIPRQTVRLRGLKKQPILSFGLAPAPSKPKAKPKAPARPKVISFALSPSITPTPGFGFAPSKPVPPGRPKVPTFPVLPTQPTPATAETLTQLTTPTPSFAFSPKLPVVTPFLRIPPPIPIQFPPGLGGRGTKIGKKPKFLNELEQGLRLFRRLF